MLRCWEFDPDMRPSFSSLVDSLSSSLAAMADYMDSDVFGGNLSSQPEATETSGHPKSGAIVLKNINFLEKEISPENQEYHEETV